MEIRLESTAGGGISPHEGKKIYKFDINRNAYLFEDVKTLDDFFACVKKVEQKEEAERLNSQGKYVAKCCQADKYKWCADNATVSYVDGEGKHYCVFHAPKGKKDVSSEEFNEFVFKGIKKAKEEDGTCDLSGTIFDGDISFSDFSEGSPLPDIIFKTSIFHGVIDFDKVIFSGKADFSHAQFHQIVYFRDASFKKMAAFLRTQFKQEADFISAKFENEVNFGGANFSQYADFDLVAFDQKVSFRFSYFKEDASFWEASFYGPADFNGVTFTKKVNFSDRGFNGETDFYAATFKGETDFTNCRFSKKANFSSGIFHSTALFLKTTFQDTAIFKDAVFKGTANFSNSEFQKNANFFQVTFNKLAFFSHAICKDNADFTSSRFDGRSNFESALFNSSTFYADVVFGGAVSFSKAHFEGIAAFENAIFQEKTDFSNVIFKKMANFESATFNGPTFFFGGTFKEHATLKGLNIKSRLRFEKANLKFTSFLDTDVRMMDFVNCEWNKRYGRDFLYDELVHFYDASQMKLKSMESVVLKEGFEVYIEPIWVTFRIDKLIQRFDSSWSDIWKHEWQGFLKDIFAFRRSEHINKVEMLYRYLKQKYKEEHNEQLTSNWHYGEKEMYRKSSLLRRYVPITFSNLYWATSGYGERPVRAGIILLLLIVAFSFFLALGGLLPLIGSSVYNLVAINDISDILKRDKLGLLILNTLQYVTFQKEPFFEPASLIGGWLKLIAQILIPVQAAFFVFALRNRYRR